MKRSGMPPRKTPIARSTKPMARTSAKKRKQNRTFQPARNAFKEELGCSCGRIATDCHEIHGGASRDEAFKMREAWLALCWEHHQEVQGWSKVKQYALKQLTDETAYDRVKLNRLAGWADEAISEAEVEAELDNVNQWLKEIRK